MTPKQDNKIIVGLDIGSTKVCAVAGRLVRDNNYARLDVLGMGKSISEGVTKGGVQNITKTADAIRKAVEEAAKQANLNIHVVNVGFSGQHISARKQHGSITRTSPGDEVTATDVEHLVGDMYRSVIPAGNEIVHVLPMDFMVDNESGIDDPVGRCGVKLEADFQVIMAQTNSASNTRRSISRTSLQEDMLLLSPLASALAVLTDEERQAGVALVDIGGGTTDIAIYHRNVLRHVAVLPFAGNSLSADIQEGCKVLPHQAEILKIKFGSADPSEFKFNQVVSVPGLSGRPPKDVLLKNLALIIEARLKEIAAMVQAEIIRAGYKDKLLGGVVITGGSAAVSGIEDLFRRVTDMHTRVGLPDLLERNPKADLVSDPAYATAVGLVWAGFKPLDERISVSKHVDEVEEPVKVGIGNGNFRPQQVAMKPQAAKEPEKPAKSKGPSIWERFKSFLNDDITPADDRYDRS
ncbi:cell division protein FtsA [Tellurirhabdus bombi]|jgi:cell division protein FtsA|uniref:cell division protein FtsA n=1 Tax=Tellurirhabdus bombi TaxID=2907205 RepID=UPI001F2A58FB|nr:cell division protein FtsA [Tellurirhabdus bombi]